MSAAASTPTSHPVRRAAGPAASVTLGVALAAGLAACGGTETKAPLPRETAADGTVFNSADARFAHDLLVQRAREFALIDLTAGRPLDRRLTSLLDEARTARAAEIDQVTTWLTDWDKPVPSTIRDHASEHAGVHHFAALEKASDAAFAGRWVAAYAKELRASDRIAAAEEAGAFDGARDLADAVEKENERESSRLAGLSG